MATDRQMPDSYASYATLHQTHTPLIHLTLATGRLMKSYAEAVRAQHPRAASTLRAIPDDDDYDWTDVSSLASCSWPSCASETDSDECRDECLPTRDQSQSDYWTHDDLLVAVDDMDGRGQRARTSTINHAHRAARLNNEINFGCFNASKPWRPVLDYSKNYRRLLAMERSAERKKKRRNLKRETSNMAGSA
ncbi:hypothetical protein JB92DRAFT_3110417 [Gautieria morchelliformis]|nr:hypothetical protein JB92DRAFT_3110417 [Gautieria morchelliformis]